MTAIVQQQTSTRMKKPVFFFLLSAAITCQAQTAERWLLPEPDAMVKASNVLCVDQAKAVLLANSLKSKGQGKEQVLALVPETPRAMSLRVVSAMRESVEDIFDFPSLSEYTQYSFRSEACFRETLGAVRMPRLAAVASQLEKCQADHGSERSAALFGCIRAVVRSVEPLR